MLSGRGGVPYRLILHGRILRIVRTARRPVLYHRRSLPDRLYVQHRQRDVHNRRSDLRDPRSGLLHDRRGMRKRPRMRQRQPRRRRNLRPRRQRALGA